MDQVRKKHNHAGRVSAGCQRVGGIVITDEQIREWFKDHRVELHKQEDGLPEVLVWKNPNSCHFRVDYIRWRGTLHVSGDIGHASYQWSCDNSLEWISELNFGYFVGKCEASEDGRDFKVFSEDSLRERLEEKFRYSIECRGDEPSEELIQAERNKFSELGGYRAVEEDRAFFWHSWLAENASEIWGDDWWESAPDGMVHNCRARGHLIGLNMAFATTKGRLT